MDVIKQNEYLSTLLLISVAIFWGITFLIIQDAIKTVPVYAFLFFRFFLAFIIMYIIFYKRLKNINKHSLFYGIILGIILFLGYSTQTFALVYTQSSIVAFLTGFFVILVPIIGYIFFKSKLGINIIIASFISIIGLYLLTSSSNFNFNKGELFALICAVFFALHIIITGKLSQNTDIFVTVLIQFFVVSILSLIFSLFLEEKTLNIDFNYSFIKALIITSIFATVYAFIVQSYMQQFISDNKTAIIFTLEPLSAAFYGMYIGNEVLSFTQIIGASFIILATIIAQVKISKNSKLNLSG